MPRWRPPLWKRTRSRLRYSPIVVNTGSKLIVIDTGTGEANFERSKGAAGQFQNNLKAAGIDRNAVDMVVISHFHGDHVNGLLTADNKPAFPNAEILVPAPEWKFWMDDGEMSRASAGRMQDLFANNRRVFDALGRKVTPYEMGKEVAPGITAVATPGHSAGHTSQCHRSGSGKVFVQADVTNLPAFRAQSRLARLLRSGSEDGRRDPPQDLRHAGGGEDDGAGIPLSLPGSGLCGENRDRLSRNSGALESDALDQALTKGRPPAEWPFILDPAAGEA